MIVIACHSRPDLVERIIFQFDKCNIDELVLFVVTDSTDKILIDFFETVDGEDCTFDFEYEVLEDKGYETGAWVHAYEKYIDEYYIFLHDSMFVKDWNWFSYFKSIRHKNTVNIWCWFELFWDSIEQKEWFLDKVGRNISQPRHGIFGSIFQVSRYLLYQIDKKHGLNNFIPKNKLQTCGMERGWMYLLKDVGCNYTIIENHFTDLDKTRFLGKDYLHRQ